MKIHFVWKAFSALIVCFLLQAFMLGSKPKPVIYIIGDSTVRNGDGSGRNGQWGWGSLIAPYFDTTKIDIQNHAIGGRSSRTFITEGRWDKILQTLKKGDYVIMQFGHNDAGPLDDTARARGTIRGIGNEEKQIYNPIRKTDEVVHTYGWYMRKYVSDAKAKGAIPIVCSPVPRNNWKEGKIARGNKDYALWARQVAEQEKAYFIDLNEKVALAYEQKDTATVSSYFFGDHTHTSKTGAEINAAKVVEGLSEIKALKMKKYMVRK
jgi:lysophospholipase L1-like esterase